MGGTQIGPHILITGAVGAGKSTLIRRLLAPCTLSVRGFRTWASSRDERGYRSFYLSPAWETAPEGTADNLVGRADGVKKEAFPAAFDRLGPPLLTARRGDVLVMDELGSLEEDAIVFQKAVMARLDGDIPVLGAVKLRQGLLFPAAVRNHPRVQLFEVNEENQDTLYEHLLPEILRWNEEGKR